MQETFIKYLQKAPGFENSDHEKAWLITVATNKCRDILRFRSQHSYADIEEVKEYTQDFTDSGIMDALMRVRSFLEYS